MTPKTVVLILFLTFFSIRCTAIVCTEVEEVKEVNLEADADADADEKSQSRCFLIKPSNTSFMCDLKNKQVTSSVLENGHVKIKKSKKGHASIIYTPSNLDRYRDPVFHIFLSGQTIPVVLNDKTDTSCFSCFSCFKCEETYKPEIPLEWENIEEIKFFISDSDKQPDHGTNAHDIEVPDDQQALTTKQFTASAGNLSKQTDHSEKNYIRHNRPPSSNGSSANNSPFIDHYSIRDQPDPGTEDQRNECTTFRTDWNRRCDDDKSGGVGSSCVGSSVVEEYSSGGYSGGGGSED